MDKEYLIHQHPLQALLIFSLPMMIGNLFQQFYTMVDSIVVGQFVSQDALAAVGASYSLTNVFISIAIGGGIGASVLTSRYFGARNYDRMKGSVQTALLSFLILSLLLAGIGLLCSRPDTAAAEYPCQYHGYGYRIPQHLFPRAPLSFLI